MREENDFMKKVSNLFESQKLAVLATDQRGTPYASLVAFSASDDLREILFATTRSTRKYANLSAKSRASLLVDDRENRDADFHGAAAATASGKVDEVPGGERKRLEKEYLSKHPYLKSFVESPSCALLRMRVEKLSLVTRFQNVREMEL